VSKCTNYVVANTWDEYVNGGPCHCPVCGGFLKWKNMKPVCNKCETPLMAFPDIDEDTGEEKDYSGKVCPIDMPVNYTGDRTQ